MTKWELARAKAGVIHENGTCVGFAAMFFDGKPDPERMVRTAKLMSAAPELLTLLKKHGNMEDEEIKELIKRIESEDSNIYIDGD